MKFILTMLLLIAGSFAPSLQIGRLSLHQADSVYAGKGDKDQDKGEDSDDKDKGKGNDKDKDKDDKHPPTVPEIPSVIQYGVGAAVILGAAYFLTRSKKKLGGDTPD